MRTTYKGERPVKEKYVRWFGHIENVNNDETAKRNIRRKTEWVEREVKTKWLDGVNEFLSKKDQYEEQDWYIFANFFRTVENSECGD